MKDGSILKIKTRSKELVGIVPLTSSSTNYRNYLEVFDFGFPVTLRNLSIESYGQDGSEIENITELNKGQLVGYLEEKAGDLYSLTKSKDLAAACFASRYHFLNEIIENVKEDNNNGIYLHNIMPDYPETGVYVLSARDQSYREEESGWRNNLDPSKINLEGIVFIPRVTPRIASQIVSRWYGNKFKSVEGVDINPGINFNSFFCHEVPDFATDFVKNPVVFNSPAERGDYPTVDYYGKK